MLNRVILEGRLGADPEKFVTQSGKTRVRFSLPLFNPYQKDGEPTEWMQCEIWNQPAEFIAKNGKKGFLVSVEGRLRNQRYTDKDGNTRYSNFISVDRLTLLEPRNRRENTEIAVTNSASTQAPVTQPAPTPVVANNAPAVIDPVKQAETQSSIDDLFKDFDGLMGN